MIVPLSIRFVAQPVLGKLAKWLHQSGDGQRNFKLKVSRKKS
jgi:hypothetical protein